MLRPLVLLAALFVDRPVAPGPASVPCAARHVSWVPSADRLYVAGRATCTLGDLARLAPDAPLAEVSPGVWFLETNLHLQSGATLVVDGTVRGGDADELRLLSDSSGFVELRAEWGTVLLRSTRVTSWDPDAGAPDTDVDNGRALVRVVSYLDGDTPRESRMDVIASDIGYLGYYAAESYGLVWKVRDPTPDVFDVVDVFGDILDSTVHHNYFGMYSYGAYGMRITGNTFHDNVQYGIDPHDDSDALVIEDNETRDNGNHGFICSKRCDRLTVRRNVSRGNVGTGFMFHRGVTGSVLEDNLAEDNRDAGFAIMDSHANTVRGNVARGNAYGVRLSVGASDNRIVGNDLRANTLYGLYLYQGSDVPTINDGRPTGNLFEGNDVSGNGALGLRASSMVGNDFIGNNLADNAEYAAFIYDADANRFTGNSLGGSWIRADGASHNEVVDSDATGLQLDGGDAIMTFTDSTGRVFENGASLATRVGAEGSSVTFTGGDIAGVVGVDVVTLRVLPQGGDVRVSLDAWGATRRVWRTSPDSADRARFVIGALGRGSTHVLWVDGVARGTVRADVHGSVTFEEDVASARYFELLSAAAELHPGPVRAGR